MVRIKIKKARARRTIRSRVSDMPSVEGFREAFPQFDEATYPNARVQFWLNLALKLLNKKRWGNFFEEGVYLNTAHNLTVERQAVENAGSGGGTGAVVSESQSIGDTSFTVRYDVATAAKTGEAESTVYGLQYLRLARIVGAGGVQL